MPTEESLLRERHQRQEQERWERLEQRRRLRVRLPPEEDQRESSITDPADRVRVINEIIGMTALGPAGSDSSAGDGGVGDTGDCPGVSGTADDPDGRSPDNGDGGKGGVARTPLEQATPLADGRVRLAPMETTPPSVNRWLESARKRK